MFIEYIVQASNEHQKPLNKIYQLLKTGVPEAIETFSYDMPTFYWKKNVVHLVDNTKYLGLYPTPTVIMAFKAKYKFSKGELPFLYSKILDETFICKKVRFRKAKLEERE